jgi:RNA polymerase sigma-70 factor (ECF subfamily)
VAVREDSIKALAGLGQRGVQKNTFPWGARRLRGKVNPAGDPRLGGRRRGTLYKLSRGQLDTKKLAERKAAPMTFDSPLEQSKPARSEEERRVSFERAFLPHLDAAYNLARWLTGNNHDAEDLAQESYLRALKAFDGFHGANSRAWLLMIVRNTCYSWFHQNRSRELTIVFEEEIHRDESDAGNPETLLLEKIDKQLLQEALGKLPLEFREALILRELEGLSYKEIADVAGIPAGTVMSRLARARKHLQRCLTHRAKPEHQLQS